MKTTKSQIRLWTSSSEAGIRIQVVGASSVTSHTITRPQKAINLATSLLVWAQEERQRLRHARGERKGGRRG